MLFELTEKGDVKGVVAEAGRFFDWMEESYGAYMMDIKLKSLEFVLRAERISYESGGGFYHFRSRQDYLPTLMELQSLEEVRAWFSEKMENACRNVAVKKESPSGSIVEKARAYIDSHYRNKDLSLDEVSRTVDISPYYFSKIFKEETGRNFVEYVTDIRIGRARELLLSSDMSMKEICGEVGYGDPNYFSRIFKKHAGVTPTEYKEKK